MEIKGFEEISLEESLAINGGASFQDLLGVFGNFFDVLVNGFKTALPILTPITQLVNDNTSSILENINTFTSVFFKNLI